MSIAYQKDDRRREKRRIKLWMYEQHIPANDCRSTSSIAFRLQRKGSNTRDMSRMEYMRCNSKRGHVFHTSTLVSTIPPIPTRSRWIPHVGRREQRRSTTTAVRETAAAFSHLAASHRVLGIHVVHQRWFLAHVSLGYFQSSCSEIPSASPTPPHPIHQGPCGPSKDRVTGERRGGTGTASGTVPGIG